MMSTLIAFIRALQLSRILSFTSSLMPVSCSLDLVDRAFYDEEIFLIIEAIKTIEV